MKNVFGFKSLSTNSIEYDGKQFITASIPADLRDEMYAVKNAEIDEQFKKDTPMWITIIGGAAFIGFIYALVTAVSAFSGSMTELITNHPLSFYGGIACAVIWLALKAVKSIRKKKMANDIGYEDAVSKRKAVQERCDSALGVPYDRKKIDIFTFYYQQKPGKDVEPLDLVLQEMSLFRDGDNLCISDDEYLFVMPISGFTRYVLQKERADMFEWNKDVAYNEGEYSRYDIEFDGDDFYSCRCYALQYSEGFDEFEIVFAEYELPIFKEIVDVPVEEE